MQQALSAEQSGEQVLLLDVERHGGRKVVVGGGRLLAAGRRAGKDLGKLTGDARRRRSLGRQEAKSRKRHPCGELQESHYITPMLRRKTGGHAAARAVPRQGKWDKKKAGRRFTHHPACRPPRQ